jgi:hypothetical protein
MTYTAKFLTVADAKRYAEKIAEPGHWKTNIVQKGRTVTFEAAIPEEYAEEATPRFFYDCLEQVGYYGSTMSRKATLNGVPAPFAW